MKNILIISLLMLCFSCKNKAIEPEKAPETTKDNIIHLTAAQLSNVNLTTTTLSKQEMATTLTVNGKIDVPPQNLVSVSVPLGGYLSSTNLLPGMHINKGDVIATVEDQQYVQLQQEYLLTKSKLNLAEQEYNRQKQLNLTQASSDKITQQAQTELNNQRITLNALAEKLKLIHINPSTLNANKISKSIPIYSTITGFVSKVNVNIGKYINPADVLFELINPTDIHLNIKVFEKDIEKISVGQKLIAYSNAQPTKKYTCEIILISKDISQEGFTDVHCHFEQYDKTLLPGMYMNAQIATHHSTNNVLPETCIVNFEGKEYVFIANNKTEFEMIPVKTGTVEKGFVQIINDTALQGKNIVSQGAYTLLMVAKNKGE